MSHRSSQEQPHRRSNRQRPVSLIVASLLLAAGCAGRQRSTTNADAAEPDHAQDGQRGKLLDGKAFCALGRHADDFPIDLDLDLPTGPDAQLDALKVMVEGVVASAKGHVSATWKLNRQCVVEQSELMFEGQAEAQARLTVEVDEDVTIENLVWSSGWTNVVLPIGPIPLFVSVQLGVTINGEIRAQDPVRLIVDGHGQVTGKLGLTQTGTEIRLDPPETFDVDLEPRIEASMDFAMDLHPVPWIDVRLYGVAGGRLTVPTDIALACTAMSDPSARQCQVDYRVAPTVQPLLGATTVDVMLWEGPVIPIPLPAALREGTVDVPVRGWSQ